jgi:hypothetical protein
MKKLLKLLFIDRSIYSLSLCIALGVFQLYVGIIPGWKHTQSDFPNYYVSSKLLVEGKELNKIYNDAWFNQQIKNYGIKEEGKFSPFPPPTAFILMPFVSFEPQTAKRLWLILNIGLLIYCASLIQKIIKWRYISCLNLLLLSGIALANNFFLGQMYLLLLVFILSGYLLITRNKKITGGIIWGIGAAIKYIPVILLFAFLNKKNQKAILGLLLSIILINLFGLFVFGIDVYKTFFRSVLFNHLDGHIAGQSQWSFAFQTWNSFFSNLFLYDSKENPAPLISSVTAFYFAKYFIHGSLIGLPIWVYRKTKSMKSENDIALILLSTTALALLPVSASYHFLLIIFPLVLFIKIYSEVNNKILLMIILFSATGFIPPLINKLYVCIPILLAYARLWLVTFFFLTIVFFLWKLPKENAANNNFR